MNNILVNIKYGGYLVQFRFRDDLNFFANNEEALIDGLDQFKISYNASVFRILGHYQNFKLKKVTEKELKIIRENVSLIKKIK